jgi:hypothetical protein
VIDVSLRRSPGLPLDYIADDTVALIGADCLLAVRFTRVLDRHSRVTVLENTRREAVISLWLPAVCFSPG